MPGVLRPLFSCPTLRTARSLAAQDETRRRCRDSMPLTSPLTLAMKIRCCRRRTVFSTFCQLIWPQLREAGVPFASVVFATVNTPFARDAATARDLHFLGNGGI